MQNNFDALELPQNEKNMACAIHHKEFLLSAEAWTVTHWGWMAQDKISNITRPD